MRLSLLHGKAAAQLQNQIRDIDLARTDFLAIAALNAEALYLIGFLQGIEPGGKNRPDAAGVNLSKNVSADQPEHRADVEARRATHALQRLLEARIVRHFVAPVVHQDDVQLFRRAVGVRHRPADDRDIAGKQLCGGAARQSRKNRRDVGKVIDQFFQPHNRNVDAGQGSHQSRVAFVGDDHDAAGFGNRDIRTADAHVGLEKLWPQFAPRKLHQLRNIRRLARLPPCLLKTSATSSLVM